MGYLELPRYSAEPINGKPNCLKAVKSVLDLSEAKKGQLVTVFSGNSVFEAVIYHISKDYVYLNIK